MRITIKRYKPLFPLLCLLAGMGTSMAQGIDFYEGTFEEAKAEAKASDKLIFVDAYAAWCGPCKRMARNVFPDSDVGEFFNENFINMKIDCEKGQGRNFAQTYQVGAYPTLFFIDGNGVVAHRVLGARDANGLIKEGKKALGADPSPLSAMERKYNEGNREPSFLYEYIVALAKADQDYQLVFAEYLLKAGDQINSTKNMELIFNLTNDIQSPGYLFFNRIEDELIQAKTLPVYHDRLLEIFRNTVVAASTNADQELFDNAQAFLKEKGIPDYKRYQLQNAMVYYDATNDWKAYSKNAGKYIKTYASEDVEILNGVAWTICQNTSSRKYTKKAVKWAEKAVELESSFRTNHTYAQALFLSEEYEAAKPVAEKAIEMAKKERQNYRPTQDLLFKINRELTAL